MFDVSNNECQKHSITSNINHFFENRTTIAINHTSHKTSTVEEDPHKMDRKKTTQLKFKIQINDLIYISMELYVLNQFAELILITLY